jgi:hypothetical protein
MAHRWSGIRTSPRQFLIILAGGIIVAALSASSMHQALADEALEVDTALILAVDVSNSVDEGRYRLQMEGIALAIEDEAVVTAITAGTKGAILLSLIEWADKAEMTIDWHLIRNVEDARAFAGKVRSLPHRMGEYTCLSRMMDIVKETIIDRIPAAAARVVLDVSGDGIDNCAVPSASDAMRDELIANDITINGLPIIVKGENDLVGAGAYRAPGFGFHELLGNDNEPATTLDKWFREHVIGGPAAFLHTAQGYEDFGRAFRQKFVTEISAIETRTTTPVE